MAVILDGKALSEKIRESLKIQVEELKKKYNKTPTLATILVGNHPASQTYVNMKVKACEKIGMNSFKIHMKETSTTEEVLHEIQKLNQDPNVDGILLQHPVPKLVDERLCFDAIDIEKDVDGVTTLGFGKISFGLPTYPSCTPAGIIRLLDEYNLNLEGKHSVVIGRSPILGKPLSMLLLQRNSTVTICHSKTKDLPEIVRTADFVFAACGIPKFVKGDWLKEGCVLVDAGYNPGNIGDADFESCYPKCSYITPVPGGVGPMTITMLLYHTYLAAEKKVKKA
ncbi:MAG: bifunctional methylenetetrahydrofolate dehydrogenase/methenyltetrahydrofolate cyclohydrolase [Leptospiraceae bacterium]|nr:bifunctional methylenetetrahydrofolate dehydrogenase/methenyltetrahydrofolate cyclohydrolase [Leptospiraceae bacterium]MDW7976070.1 tetrahydrofolate dehydrogenase/cyclohydrolase catalytic domain-containing protein [Leptospiraceae bacterium]